MDVCSRRTPTFTRMRHIGMYVAPISDVAAHESLGGRALRGYFADRLVKEHEGVDGRHAAQSRPV